jgi:hypothetical protein
MLAEQRVKLFSVYSGSVYSRSVDFHIDSVKQNGTYLTPASSIASVSEGKYFYSSTERKIYLRTIGSLDPKDTDISLVNKLFFSTTPIILPNDLSSGDPVEWLPYIETIGSIGQSLDDKLTGVVLESASNIQIQNNHGYFDPIFDTLLWENKEINFYSWINGTPLSEIKKIFSGIVESKEFSPQKVTFNVRDFIFRLRDTVNLGTFSESDGSILDSLLGTSKRRIYGRVDKCQTVGVDAVKDGFNLTGTVTIASLSNTLTGTGTIFLSELSPNDEIIVLFNGEEIKFTIDTISSDTSATVSRESDTSILNFAATVKPFIPYRGYNRDWHIAGHKLRQSTAVISSVVSSRQFIVDDVSEFFADDFVTVSGITTQITRVSGNNIILEQAITPIPLVGDLITKEPILRARFGNNILTLNRDFTISNTTEAILNIDPLAEFNISKERRSSVSFTFTNGSRNVTTAATIDLRTILKPRDWIRKLTQSSDVWFEILSVNEQSLILRTVFSQTGGTEIARFKNVEIIDDESIITVDCYGMDYEDKWMMTASNAARHLVKFDAGFTQINEDTFLQASSDCPHVMSMVIPSIGEKPPTIREVLNMINESVFGSLYGNSIQQVCYSIVNARRPEAIKPIKDDDILDWSSTSDNSIVNKVIVNYAPYTDTVNGGDAFLSESYESEFVNRYSKISNTDEYVSYLYDQKSARIMAQRRAFYKSTSSLQVTLKAKALFFDYSVNDRIYIELDRLFKRYGSSTRKKIGIVSGVKKTSTDSELTLNDMGNIFNRCPTIAPNGTNVFSTATEDEKIKYGFILGTTLTPDITSEDELGNCLIG